jgi:hypothetical protein
MTKLAKTVAKIVQVAASRTTARPGIIGSRSIQRAAYSGQARASLFAATFVGCAAVIGCGGGAAHSTIGPCSNVVATGSPGLIDELNHAGANIPHNDGRQGYWYTWNDGTGTQTPPGALGGTCQTTTFAPTNGQACTSGSGFTVSGAGIGVGVEYGPNCASCNYDATAYKGGVRFTISGIVTGNLRFIVTTAEVTPVEFGGLCTDGTKCWDSYGLNLKVTTQPQVVEIPWTSLAQQGWGTPALFDLRYVQMLQWNVQNIGATPVSFDNLCIDDVSFY